MPERGPQVADDPGHLGQVRALAAEQIAHGAVTLGLTGTEGVDFDGIKIFNNSNVGNFACYNSDTMVASLTVGPNLVLDGCAKPGERRLAMSLPSI